MLAVIPHTHSMMHSYHTCMCSVMTAGIPHTHSMMTAALIPHTHAVSVWHDAALIPHTLTAALIML